MAHGPQESSMVQDLLQAVGYDEDSALRAIDDSCGPCAIRRRPPLE